MDRPANAPASSGGHVTMWLRVVALFAVASVVSAPAVAALGAGGSGMELPGGLAACAEPAPATRPAEAGDDSARARATDPCAETETNSAGRQQRPASPAPSAEADRAPLAIALIALELSPDGPTSACPGKSLPATAASVDDGSGAAAAMQRAVCSAAPGEGLFPPEPGAAAPAARWRVAPGKPVSARAQRASG